MRIREDHNLVATLNSLVEAAMRKGDDAEAIAALRELVRLEPNEPIHLQRLYNLGVRDLVESDAPDVVRATGPLDYQSAVFDDAFVIRQISEAEILAGHGQVDQAVGILTGILQYAPEHVQVHLKLKDIYLRAGVMDKAAAECVELSRIHEARGESARASDYYAEAQQLNPFIASQAKPAQPGEGAWSGDVVDAFAFGQEAAAPAEAAAGNGDSGFDFHESAGGLDWARYQTGQLTDHTGFVTIPEGEAKPASGNGNGAASPQGDSKHSFRYSDMLVGDNGKAVEANANAADAAFSSAGDMPSDTMPRILRDELEGIDFYIAQGYIEIARDTLDRLRAEQGDHPEILSRYSRLGDNSFAMVDPAGQPQESQSSAAEASYAVDEPVYLDPGAGYDLVAAPEVADESPDQEMDLAVVEEAGEVDSEELPGRYPDGDLSVAVDEAHSGDEGPQQRQAEEKQSHFMIHKESGPLYPDLIVQLNTSDLLNDTMFDAARLPTGPLPSTPDKPIGTADLIESIVSSFDSSFSEIQQPDSESSAQSGVAVETEAEAGAAFDIVSEPEPLETEEEFSQSSIEQGVEEAEQQAVEPAEQAVAHETLGWSEPAHSSEHAEDLADIFEELKENTGELKGPIDFETHYSLGLAYKDMDLLDEAIEEFQLAFRMAGLEDLKGDYIQCCNMLGVCFKRKQMPKLAIMWFQRGLRIQSRPEDEYQALRYEIGICYEELGDHTSALDSFMEVYGTDVNYREVGEKIKHLQALKSA
jgi:tetratricopeptide (TPR) repeat protein